MTFRQWLKANYAGTPFPAGDLYEDMRREDQLRRKSPEQYPQYALWKTNRKWIIEHLRKLNASKETIQVFKDVWKEYRQDVKMGFA